MAVCLRGLFGGLHSPVSLPLYYFPKEDVRMELLEQTDRVTRCPYKGEANLYSINIGEKLHEGLAWIYPYPTLECTKFQGLAK